jgi:hypothetical protein
MMFTERQPYLVLKVFDRSLLTQIFSILNKYSLPVIVLTRGQAQATRKGQRIDVYVTYD